MQNQFTETVSLGQRLKSLALLLVISGSIFIVDQLSKQWVLNNLNKYSPWEPIPAWGRLLKFTYVHNTGAAFGLFPNGGNLFLVIALIVTLAILYYIFYQPNLPTIILLTLSLQLGGALGNMVDRIRHGWVVDFIDIGFWPIFNVADISIVVGVIFLGFWLWEEEEAQKEQALATNL